MNWAVLLTSAAIGAVVSSVLTLFGQHFERRARRRELLLSKAIELAFAHRETIMRVAEKDGLDMKLQDDIISAETYFHWLTALFDKGELPDDPRIQRLTPRERD